MNRLKKLRAESKLSLRKLQEYVGIDFSHLSKIEKADVNIELNTIKKLSDFFNVSTSYFLGGDGFITFYHSQGEKFVDLAYFQFKEAIESFTPEIVVKNNKIIRILNDFDYGKIISQFNIEREALAIRIKVNDIIEYLDSLSDQDYNNAKELIEEYFAER